MFSGLINVEQPQDDLTLQKAEPDEIPGWKGSLGAQSGFH